MASEFIGEVTVRSSEQGPIVATEAIAKAGPLGPIGPGQVLVGPVTIRLDGDGRGVMIGGSPTEPATAKIYLDGKTGDITVRDHNAIPVLRFDSQFAVLDIGGLGNEGDIRVRNAADATTIHLDGGSGDITLSNGDAAEDFDVSSLEEATPGTVMVLEEDGRLHPCSSEYDSRVVGVVAGAGSFRPAVILDRQAGAETPRAAISILGKVAVRADATYIPIRAGDLLTTSATRGRAMAAEREQVATGAVLGKALSKLDEGVGMVDMLISLH
ncbi:MAG: hypothetical protein K0T01_2325 [Acidimicrobiia bacterium]|nr:hypothetical protein [Acidimicrobiia bacterium]